MSEQPLDLRSSLTIIARHRTRIAAFVLIGAALGLLWGLLSPARPTATALVLLPPSEITSTGTPARDMRTQIAVAESVPVLSAAAKRLSAPMAEQRLKKSLHVSAVSADVLSFRAADASADGAARIANAAANAYVQYVNSPESLVNAGSLAALQAQAASLNTQLQSLQAQVNSTQSHLAGESPTSPDGQRDASLLGALNTEQQAVSVELNNVTSQIIQDQASTQVGAATTRVLQSAQVSDPAQLTHLTVTGAEVAGAGLILGCIAALGRGRRDRRLRKRVDIATAAGAPMLASLPSPAPKTARAWWPLLTPGGGDSADNWSLSQLLQSLALDSRTARPVVEVISFADDTASLTVGPRLAAFAASCGTVTRLEVADVAATEKLRSACSSLNRAGVPATIQLAIGDGANSDNGGWRSQPAPPCKLTIRCRVVTRGEPAVTRDRADATILALAPGIASADEIAVVALHLDERGERFDGTILVNPDPTDDTAGFPRHLAVPGHTDVPSDARLGSETTTSSERKP